MIDYPKVLYPVYILATFSPFYVGYGLEADMRSNGYDEMKRVRSLSFNN